MAGDGEVAMQQLTPRMSRVVATAASQDTVDIATMKSIANAMGMSSIMAATVFWDTQEEFLESADAEAPLMDQGHVKTLWFLLHRKQT